MEWQRRHKTQCSQIPADAERRSSQELLEEIEQLLEMDAAEMDTDRLDAYLDILQARAPVMEDYDAKAEWEKTKAQHPLLFAPEPAKHPKKSGTGKWFRPVRALEIAVAAALLLMITANALGCNPIRQFLDWADGIVRVYSNPSGEMTLPPDDPSEYHSLAEAMEAYGIDPESCPTWIPAEYTLDGVAVRDSDGLLRISAVYRSERGELLIRVTKHKSFLENDWGNAIERDESSSTFEANGKECYVVTNSNRVKAGWIQDANFYEVIGQISEDECKEIIKSIM